jgi:hypothetical protein
VLLVKKGEQFAIENLNGSSRVITVFGKRHTIPPMGSVVVTARWKGESPVLCGGKKGASVNVQP